MSFLNSIEKKSKKFESPFTHWELNEPLTKEQIVEIINADIDNPILIPWGVILDNFPFTQSIIKDKINFYINIGTGNDLKIYHSGANSFIHDGGAGDLKILGGNLKLQNQI